MILLAWPFLAYIAFQDHEFWRIPNKLLLGLLCVAIAIAILESRVFVSVLAGVLCFVGMSYLGSRFGKGDWKLAFVIGVICGPLGSLFVMPVAIAIHWLRCKFARLQVLPFAPSMFAAFTIHVGGMLRYVWP